MKRDNCSPEMEMLLLAELISYPYHLRQIPPDSLIPLVMDPEARKVLDVLIVMKNNDEEVSLSNVSYHLSDQQVIERLTNSFLKVATDSPIQQHIGYLKELSVNRTLEQLALNILGMSKDLTTPSSEKLSKIINESSQILEDLSECRSVHPILEIINAIGDDIQERAAKLDEGRVVRVPTGLYELDRFLYGGFGSGNLIVLAGRPSEGKTAIMVQMAREAAVAGVPALIFSLEMSKEEVVQRFLVATGNIRSEQIHMAKVDDWTEFEAGVAKVCNLPIYVDDSTRVVADIVAKASAMNAKGKCGIVCIDYLGLIRFDGKQPLYIQISEVTKSMKRLAKDCRCPVVLLCQLNRNSVRDGRPPDLQDLRDSGSIEQDADIVLIIERVKTGGVNLWLRKNRHGYGGEVCLHLDHDTNYSNFRAREE